MSTFVPYVIEQTSKGERVSDIYSRLLKDRIVFLGSQVTREIANSIIAQMLFLNATSSDDKTDEKNDIKFYINSPGGCVNSGLAIYDIMNLIKKQCDIRTYCLGQAASMGAFLLSAGTKGKRFAMPSAEILIHQPHLGNGGIGGQATDIEIHAKNIIRKKEVLNKKLAEHTGQTLAQITADCERDKIFDAQEALSYGLIDQIHGQEEKPAKQTKTNKKKTTRSRK